MISDDYSIESWLPIQCGMLVGATQAVVLLADASGGYNQAWTWPGNSQVGPALLNAAAANAGNPKNALVPVDSATVSRDTKGIIVTSPLNRGDDYYGVIAVYLAEGNIETGRACAKALLWGRAWLNLLREPKGETAEANLLVIIDMVASTLEHSSFDESAAAVAAELARRFACERVSLGFLRRGRTRVLAMSRSASADSRMALLRSIGASMDEAIDQDATLVFPQSDQQSQSSQIFAAHKKLLTTYGGGGVCTVPIAHEGQLVAAITFEHKDPEFFNRKVVGICEAVAALVGPILASKRQAERWIGPHMFGSSFKQIRNLIEPGHVRLKLGVTAAVVTALFLGFATGEYRVAADAVIESTTQRSVTAPFDGYVDESSVRPGDIVSAGALLCRLEDRDLKLEEIKWSSEAAKLRKEYREALAGHERSRVRIIQAQLEQASAQLALAKEQLARTQVSAPVDGMIVKGDLTQSLGAPVQRGDVLFEVAPLNEYRVMLSVDEREVGRVKPGLPGQLALAGMPVDRLPIEVGRITPVSSTEDGANYFLVEAKIMGDDIQVLRPGMQGIGKISVGERKLIWIWTHEMIDWLRLQSWGWFA